MTQQELVHYYEKSELRCKFWSVSEIKQYIKAEFGDSQRVYKTTCYKIKRYALLFQH